MCRLISKAATSELNLGVLCKTWDQLPHDVGIAVMNMCGQHMKDKRRKVRICCDCDLPRSSHISRWLFSLFPHHILLYLIPSITLLLLYGIWSLKWNHSVGAAMTHSLHSSDFSFFLFCASWWRYTVLYSPLSTRESYTNAGHSFTECVCACVCEWQGSNKVSCTIEISGCSVMIL